MRSAAATAGGGREPHKETRDTKAGLEGKWRPLSPRAPQGAQPSTPPGQGPPNFCEARSQRVPGPRRGPSAYFRTGCPSASPQTPPAFFLLPTFWPRCPRRLSGVPPRLLPAPSRRLPLHDFVATKREGASPTKGVGSGRRPCAWLAGWVDRWGGGAGCFGRVWGTVVQCH